MNEQDFELLSQYLDGELAAPVARELELRLAVEPELQACLKSLSEVNLAVKNTFNVAGADTVPARVRQLLRKPDSTVIAFPGANRNKRIAGWGFAAAASLVIASGALLNVQTADNSGEFDPFNATDDQLLSQILEQSPSRAEGWDTLESGRQVRPVLSFATAQGRWCREYLLSGQSENWRGVACRSDGQWATEVLSREAVTGSSSEYRPAGANDSEKVASFMDEHAADVALSARQEAELIARQWQ